jgi:hypothetical protein
MFSFEKVSCAQIIGQSLAYNEEKNVEQKQ